jgi:hypothetical protein
MNNFEKLNKVNENFKNQLENKDDYPLTKGILSNFGNFINKNKGMLYGMLGATILNFASSSLQPVFAAQEPVHISQTSKISNLDNFESQFLDYNQNIKMGNSPTSSKAISSHSAVVDLNSDSIKAMSNLKQDESITVKNPFWANNVIEMKKSFNQNMMRQDQSYFDDSTNKGISHQLTHNNASLIVDSSEQQMFINFTEVNGFVNNFAKAQTEDQKMDLTKYVIYHEAAHGSTRQSMTMDPTSASKMTDLDMELHSDLSSIMLIGIEAGNLARFNYVADKIISARMTTIQYDFEHSTSYGLIELKKAVNDNPELLKMNKGDISEFSYNIVKKLSEKDFSVTSEYNDMKGDLKNDTKSILEDMKNGKNEEAINYFAGKVYNKGIFGFNYKKFDEARWPKLADRMSQKMNQPVGYDDVPATLLISVKKEVDKLDIKEDKYADTVIGKIVDKIEKHIDDSPAIDANMIAIAKTKIKMDSMFESSTIQEVSKSLNNKIDNEPIVKNNGFKNNSI